MQHACELACFQTAPLYPGSALLFLVPIEYASRRGISPPYHEARLKQNGHLRPRRREGAGGVRSLLPELAAAQPRHFPTSPHKRGGFLKQALPNSAIQLKWRPDSPFRAVEALCSVLLFLLAQPWGAKGKAAPSQTYPRSWAWRWPVQVNCRCP